jgi:hypothetical protein
MSQARTTGKAWPVCCYEHSWCEYIKTNVTISGGDDVVRCQCMLLYRVSNIGIWRTRWHALQCSAVECNKSTLSFPVTPASGSVRMSSGWHLPDQREMEINEGIDGGHFQAGISRHLSVSQSSLLQLACTCPLNCYILKVLLC